jgi:hypothetical protein
LEPVIGDKRGIRAAFVKVPIQLTGYTAGQVATLK